MALIPPFFVDCVISIGIQTNENEKDWIGTGFLFAKHLSDSDNNPDESCYKVFLVTNKHVLENQKDIIVRFNPQNGQAATDFPITLQSPQGKQLWTGHPAVDVDVAVLPIDIQKIKAAGMKFSVFKSNKDILTLKQLIDEQVSEGDFIYVLGYPMGLMPFDRQHVIARSGIIARIRDLFENRSKSFMIDSFVFPGSSGGPVIYKPEVVAIQGTKSLKSAVLIGIVKGYIPYREIAISQQTQLPRVFFEENSGLAIVETVDKIMDTIEADEIRNDLVLHGPYEQS